MKKKLLAGLATCFFVFSMTEVASADFITIGSAGYDSNGNGTIDIGENYSLIYDNDDDLIWLDYTNSRTSWWGQGSWAAGLNADSALTINIDKAYDLTWDLGDVWEVASIVELAELGKEVLDKNYAGNFGNVMYRYWSGSGFTQYSSDAWDYGVGVGQRRDDRDYNGYYGIAVRSGYVSAAMQPVPEPATMILLGTGLVGLAGARRRRRKIN